MSARLRSSLMLLLLVALVTLPAASAHAKGRPGGGGGAGLELTSEAVVPGPGDLGASGNAVLNVGHNEVCYTITVSGLSGTITEIALYQAPAGQTGPEVLRLTPSPIGLMSLNACIPADGTLVRAIQRNPSAYYLQVRTTLYSNGALRAQLH